MTSDISLHLATDGIATITFSRPEVSNAVRRETMEGLCDALDQCSGSDEIKAVVIAAEGRNFVAGADFNHLRDLLASSAPDVRDGLYRSFKGAVERVWKSPKPMVAAINGAAVTVGCELVLACDARVATPRTRFGEIWLQLGLMPPLGGTVLLPRLVGLTWAKKMILEAQMVDGATALQIGLVDELVSDEDLLSRARERALAMAAFPPTAFAAAKAALHRGFESTLEREWELNVQTQSELIGSDFFRQKVEDRLAR